MNLCELFDSAGVAYKRAGEHHHVSRGWLGVDCPKCSPGSGKYRLGFNERTGSANCWSCGRLAKWDTLAMLTGLKLSEVKKPLDTVLVAPTNKVRGRYVRPATSPMGENHDARLYLESRGFDTKRLYQFWGVHEVIRASAKNPSRVFIPITRDHEEVSWTSRDYHEEGKRYQNAPVEQESVPAKHLLYGEELCRGACVVVEGCTDVWRIGPGAVAVMGAAFSDEQVLRIGKFALRAVCFDGDETGRERGRELASRLQAMPGETYFVKLETSKDAGGADPQEVSEIRKRFLDER